MILGGLLYLRFKFLVYEVKIIRFFPHYEIQAALSLAREGKITVLVSWGIPHIYPLLILVHSPHWQWQWGFVVLIVYCFANRDRPWILEPPFSTQQYLCLLFPFPCEKWKDRGLGIRFIWPFFLAVRTSSLNKLSMFLALILILTFYQMQKVRCDRKWLKLQTIKPDACGPDLSLCFNSIYKMK